MDDGNFAMISLAADATEKVLNRLPSGFPGHTAEAIMAGVRRNQEKFFRAEKVSL